MSTNTNDIFNVKDYGAVGNGSTDDQAAIQTAINAADNNKGGVVFFPPGKYLISSSLELKGIVQLKGVGWNGYNPDVSGSYVYFQSGFSGNAINVFGRGSQIHDLGFTCDQPAFGENWSPNDFSGGFAINIAVDDVKVSNVLLFNVTRGINMSHHAASVGRITLDRIFGQPVTEGIKIDNALDVIKVNNVHFWPFWTGDSNVRTYQLQNAKALTSYRNDNPFYSDIFCLNYSMGMFFGESTTGANSGSTSKFKIVNADLDFCGRGLVVHGNNTTGQFSNLSCQGPNVDDPNYEGIQVHGNNISIQGSNVDITHYKNNGVRIEGESTRATFENIWIREWNLNGEGHLFPGIEVVNSGATIYIGNGRWFDNGHGASDTGGSGTFHLS